MDRQQQPAEELILDSDEEKAGQSYQSPSLAPNDPYASRFNQPTAYFQQPLHQPYQEQLKTQEQTHTSQPNTHSKEAVELEKEETYTQDIHEKETRDFKQEEKQEEKEETKKEKKKINHEKFALYANSSLETRQNLLGILIRITSHETRATTFSQYTVYLVEGKDRNGEFTVYRRFNEFHLMRVALQKRFPGCYIPSIPSKDLMKNSEQVVKLRLRYLNDFVRRMAALPHLYYSAEFQALLRSKEKDITAMLSSWTTATVAEIITRYKESFAEMLNGKEVNVETSGRISAFAGMLRGVRVRAEGYRRSFKGLAEERDKMDGQYMRLLGVAVKGYEETNLQAEEIAEMGLARPRGVCLNAECPKMEEHDRIVHDALKRNPYWLLYDVMQQEAREAEAFLQAVAALDQYRSHFASKEVRIMELSKSLLDLTKLGKNNDEQKFKLEVQQEKAKAERDQCLRLVDIMTASLAYFEVERFKKERIEELRTTLQHVAAYEINMVQNIGEIWHDWLNVLDTVKSS